MVPYDPAVDILAPLPLLHDRQFRVGLAPTNAHCLVPLLIHSQVLQSSVFLPEKSLLVGIHSHFEPIDLVLVVGAL